MPNWPYRMQADLACAFCGMSKTAFLNRAGTDLPAGIRDHGNVYWYTDDLQEALDALRLKDSHKPERQGGWRGKLDGLRGSIGNAGSAG